MLNGALSWKIKNRTKLLPSKTGLKLKMPILQSGMDISKIHSKLCLTLTLLKSYNNSYSNLQYSNYIYRSPERFVMSHSFRSFVLFGWLSMRRVVNREIPSNKPNRSSKNKCRVHAFLSLIYSLIFSFFKNKRILGDKNAFTLH